MSRQRSISKNFTLYSTLEVRSRTIKVYINKEGQFAADLDPATNEESINNPESDRVVCDSIAKLKDALSRRVGRKSWDIPIVERVTTNRWHGGLDEEPFYREGIITGRHSNGNLLVRWLTADDGPRRLDKPVTEQLGRGFGGGGEQRCKGSVDKVELERLHKAVADAEQALLEFKEANMPVLPEE